MRLRYWYGQGEPIPGLSEAGEEKMRALLPFVDRSDAGSRLADELGAYAGRNDVLVLALPRGGVAVGAEVARKLGAPLDVILVRKLGVPGHEEFAMGAIASGGIRIISDDVVAALGVSDREMAVVAAAEEEELARQERVFRGTRDFPDVRDRSIILVDDGLATGATMRAAAAAIGGQSPARLVVAVPVAPKETCAALRTEVDEVICLATPEPFHSVGSWYEDFHQTSDEEVRLMLQTR
jgi:predicted phosphoribosyltransferase